MFYLCYLHFSENKTCFAHVTYISVKIKVIKHVLFTFISVKIKHVLPIFLSATPDPVQPHSLLQHPFPQAFLEPRTRQFLELHIYERIGAQLAQIRTQPRGNTVPVRIRHPYKYILNEEILYFRFAPFDCLGRIRKMCLLLTLLMKKQGTGRV